MDARYLISSDTDSTDWLRLRSTVQDPEKSGFGAVVACGQPKTR